MRGLLFVLLVSAGAARGAEVSDMSQAQPRPQIQFYGNVLGGLGFGAAMQVLLEPQGMPAGVFGWSGAAGTNMWVDPVHRLHLVLMTQYWPATINQSFRTDPATAAYADLGLWPAGENARLR